MRATGRRRALVLLGARVMTRNPSNFALLRPLVPYNVPPDQQQAELSALDRGRLAALEWLDRAGIREPGFKENRRKESGK